MTKSRGGNNRGSAIIDENRNSNLKVTVPIEDFLIQELKKGQNVNLVSVDSNLAAAIRDEAIAELKARNKKDKDANENVKNLPEIEPTEDLDDVPDDQGGWEDLPDDDPLPAPDLLDQGKH